MHVSRTGCAAGRGGNPTVSAGVVSSATVEKAAIVSAPDDHFTASPDCRMLVTHIRCLLVVITLQLLVRGLYLPPLLRKLPLYPPHTTISWPVQTAVDLARAVGARAAVVATHLFEAGLYLAPLSR